MSTRRVLDAGELAVRYTMVLAAAAPAGFAGAAITVAVLRATHALCERDVRTGSWGCPDGIGYAIPALLGAGAAVWLVLAVGAGLIARGTVPDTIDRMARHALGLSGLPLAPIPLACLAAAIFADYPADWAAWRPLLLIIALVAAALTLLPTLLVSRKPERIANVLWWLGLLAVLFFATYPAHHLVLLAPSAAGTAGCWVLAMLLHLRAHARRPLTEPSP